MNLDTVKYDLQDLQTILSKIGKVAGCVKVFNFEDNNTFINKNSLITNLLLTKK
mgnify:CR=1 FL=1